MQTKTKVILVAIAAAAFAFMLNPNAPLGAAIWGPVVLDGGGPTGIVLALLTAYSVIEAIVFGAGVAFITFGWRLAKKAAASLALARAAFVAIAWMLVSWVPHTAMHMTNAHGDYARLALIEYVFHFTLLLSALVLMRFFLDMVRKAEPQARATTAAEEGIAA